MIFSNLKKYFGLICDTKSIPNVSAGKNVQERNRRFLHSLIGIKCFILAGVLILSTALSVRAQILTPVEVEFPNTPDGIFSMWDAYNIAITPDGKFVFVASLTDNAFVAFSRNTSTGLITHERGYRNGSTDAVGVTIEGLVAPRYMVVSPDGKHLYIGIGISTDQPVGDGDGIVVFGIDSSTGNLSFIEYITNGDQGITALNSPVRVELSPDGKNLYVASANGGAEASLVVFSRDSNTGMLTFVEVLLPNFGDHFALFAATVATVSPDGKNVYVTSQGADAITVFSRNGDTGALTFMEIHFDDSLGVDGLDRAIYAAVSPDGEYVYVSGSTDDAISIFDRDTTTGALTYVDIVQNGVNGVEGLNQAEYIVFSPGGEHMYVGSVVSDAVAVFSRNSTTGALTFIEAETNKVNGVWGINGTRHIIISPDGANVYAVGQFNDAIATFGRDAGTGALTFLEFHRNVQFHDVPLDIEISPDDRFAYVTGNQDDALVAFSIDQSTGELTEITAYFDGLDGLDSFDGPRDVKISPDGAHLYVNIQISDALVVFSRNSTDGTLSLVEILRNNENGVDGLDNTRYMAISPDGKNVYVTAIGGDKLAVFSRNSTTGALTFTGIQQNNVDGVEGMDNPLGITIDPDGKNVYVSARVAAGNTSLVVFSRNESTGALTFVQSFQQEANSLDFLRYGNGPAVSPDGKFVYTVGGQGVTVFSRDIGSGTVSFVENVVNGEKGVSGLNNSRHVTISPDGSLVFVNGRDSNALAVFHRNESTGKLIFQETHDNSDFEGWVNAFRFSESAAITHDGKFLYETSLWAGRITVFKVNQSPSFFTWMSTLGFDGGVEGASIDLEIGTSLDGTSGIDAVLGETELPPSPPADNFDVRSTGGELGNGLVRDIRSSEQDTLVWTIAIQHVSGSTQMTWDSGHLINLGVFILEDLVGGSVLKVDMTTTGETSIPSTLTSVKITMTPKKSNEWPIDLSSGWSMVSLGLDVADASLSTLFPNAISAFQFSSGYVEVSELTAGEGYWLNLDGALTTTVSGNSLSSLELNLTDGWSMIGALTEPVAISGISQSPENSIISLFKFDGGYTLVTDFLKQGEGYWINLSNAATLTLNSSAVLKSSSTTDQVTDILSNFKNLSLNLISGYDTRRIDLYFGDDVDDETLREINNSFELPPPAPEWEFGMVIDEEGTNGLFSFAAKIGNSFEKRITIVTPEGNSPVTLYWNSEGLEPEMYYLSDDSRDLEIDMEEEQELDLQPGTEYALVFSYKRSSNVITKYLLNPNYPNPFNPTTRISYAIADPGFVSVIVLNILGQEVKTLLNMVQSTGNYEVVWDATDNSGRGVGAGIYFYKLQVNNFVEIRKMVLVK